MRRGPSFRVTAAGFCSAACRLSEPVDENHYGAQGELVLAGSDGSNPTVLGQGGEYPWASWSPDGKQVACLSIKGITIVDVVTRQVVRKLPSTRLFPAVDLVAGRAMALGRVELVRRELERRRSSRSRRQRRTPSVVPIVARLTGSRTAAVSFFRTALGGNRRDDGNGWSQLWMADADGRNRRLVYGEDGRHIYGGQVSPDGKYVVFTGSVEEVGDPRHAGAPMGLLRLADAPIIGGESRELRKLHPEAKRGPVLVLPTGWEPCWTAAEIDHSTTPH